MNKPEGKKTTICRYLVKRGADLFQALDHVGADVEVRVERAEKELPSLVRDIQNVVNDDI